MAGKRSAPSAPQNGNDKKKGRRITTTESIIAQKIRDNFRDFGPEETDCKKSPHDSMTLRQRLTHDYLKAKDKNVSFGRNYYEALRSVYAAPVAAHRALAPSDPDLPISPILVKSMLAAQRSKPDRSLIQGYMASLAQPPNATEVCGLFRYFITLRPGCMVQLAMSMDCLRFIARHKLQELHSDLFVHMKPWLDRVLIAMLMKSRSRKNPDTVFIDLNLPFIEMLLPKAPLAKVLACKSGWLQVHSELMEVCSQGQFGKDLFEHSLVQVVAEQVQNSIQEAIKAAFLPAGAMTAQKLADAIQQCMNSLMTLPSIDFLPAKRQISIDYRGHPISVRTTSLAEEVTLRFTAAQKSIAVSNKTLPRLWCEDLVIDSAWANPYKATVAKSTMKEPAAARDMAKTVVTDANATTADAIAKLLNQKTPSLILLDPAFKLELGIVSELTSDTHENKLMARILKELPSAQKIVQVESVAQKLNALSGTDLYRLSSRSSQEKLKLSQTMIAAIVESRRPEVQSALADEYLSKVVSSFQWFLQFKAHGAKAPSYGVEAALHMLKALETKSQQQKATLDDIAPLRVFYWLLDDSQAEIVDRLAKQVASSASTTLAVVKDRGTKKKGGKEATDTALENALNMFK